MPKFIVSTDPHIRLTLKVESGSGQVNLYYDDCCVGFFTTYDGGFTRYYLEKWEQDKLRSKGVAIVNEQIHID